MAELPAEAPTEPKPEPQPDSQSQINPQAKPEHQPEAQPKPKSEPQPEPKSEAKPEQQPQAKPEPQPLRWFALRVFNNRIQQVKEELEALGVRTYQALRTTTLTHDGKPLTRNGRPVTRQIQLAPSLLFVHWDASRIKEFKQQRFTELMLYRKSGSQEPAPIPDREMEMFILVTTAGDGSDPGALQLLEPTPFDFKPGEKVRVIEGPFKGAEGIIRRIKKDRKLLVAVQGVVVVAISHIPAAFLERLPASGEKQHPAPEPAKPTTQHITTTPT